MEVNTSDQEAPPPFIRRYGEPDWEYRPQVSSAWYSDQENLPHSTDESFEEWLVEVRSKTDKTPRTDTLASIRLNNPLAILMGNVGMVDVVVGEGEGNIWRLHEKLLCSESCFFSAAFSNPFQEAAEKKVYLVEEDNAVFALFVQWLYTRSFSTADMDLILRAYVLGDRLRAASFSANAIDKIYGTACWCNFTVEQALWVVEHTVPESALRKLIMDSMAFKVLTGSMAAFASEDWESLAPIHGELLQAVTSLAQFNARANRIAPWMLPPRLAYTEST